MSSRASNRSERSLRLVDRSSSMTCWRGGGGIWLKEISDSTPGSKEIEMDLARLGFRDEVL